jgi:two-component system, sensor histidine kinase and response regulator
MNLKQLIFRDAVNPGNNRNEDRNLVWTKQSPDRLEASIPDIHTRRRIKELEETNSRLLKRLENLSKEHADFVSTNSRLISILTHDLRSPFITILGMMEILKGHIVNNNLKETERYIDIASNSASSTLNLVDNLLAWNTSQNQFNPVKINLQDLVQDVFNTVYACAESKRISLHSSISSELMVIADVQMVKAVFRNLLNNAIKYSHSGGRISIIASNERQYVEIVVIDSGIGMSTKLKNSLFKKNMRNSVNGTYNEHGTGLGLMLCKEFIEINSGTISVESERGIGTRVIFTLPRYQNIN